MDKRFWIILLIIVGVMVGLFALTGGKETSSNTKFEGDPRQVQAVDWTQGPSDAPVTLIEFADFQCAGCASIFPVLQQIKAEFSENLQFVFRHYPLTSIHANAMASHRAAEAAGKQGKFWEMHDLLYQRQQLWSSSTSAPATFEGYAQELGLNVEQFKTDLASQEVFDRISRDMDGGSQIGISATPTLILNGQQIDTPRSAEELSALIQEAINSVNTEN